MRRTFDVALPLSFTKLLIHLGVAKYLPGVQHRLNGGADFLRYYSNRLLLSPLDQLPDAASFVERHAPDVLDLALGVPAFDATHVSTRFPADNRDWPPISGLPELRAAVASKLLNDNCVAVDPEHEVLISAGALGAVQTVLDAFVNVGDRVVLFDPTAPLYPLLAPTRGARLQWLATWMEDGRTRFRLDQLARALSNARLLILTSPSNHPTGGVVAVEDLEQIVWWANRQDVLILSDEVFERFHHDHEPVSIASLPGARERTLTVGSVSKGHGLASARVGWIAGHRHLVQPCLATAALRTPFVPAVCQQMALAALQNDPAPVDDWRDELAARRRYVFERLRSLELSAGWPAGAFFFWISVWELGLSGREFAEALLREHKVRVAPGDLFGPSGVGYIRLSYAIDEGRLQEALNRLASFVEGLRGREQASVMKRAA
jgi:aminotransferase